MNHDRLIYLCEKLKDISIYYPDRHLYGDYASLDFSAISEIENNYLYAFIVKIFNIKYNTNHTFLSGASNYLHRNYSSYEKLKFFDYLIKASKLEIFI
jgi:hypothetical protein